MIIILHGISAYLPAFIRVETMYFQLEYKWMRIIHQLSGDCRLQLYSSLRMGRKKSFLFVGFYIRICFVYIMLEFPPCHNDEVKYIKNDKCQNSFSLSHTHAHIFLDNLSVPVMPDNVAAWGHSVSVLQSCPSMPELTSSWTIADAVIPLTTQFFRAENSVRYQEFIWLVGWYLL